MYSHFTKAPGWLIPSLWIVLAALLLALVVIAGFLVGKTNVFSEGPLTDEQMQTLWTFLGVALGAVVTLIGTLLTDQHNRRTAALEREVAEREDLARAAQQARDDQAERRLTLDTVARLLEILTKEDGEYAKSARVGGAIATMVQLEGGTVALRILDDLWSARAMDRGTAVWLVQRVLNGNRPADEQLEAASLLSMHSADLVPSADDPKQDWHLWPTLNETWPQSLSTEARNAMVVLAVRGLLAREPAWWRERDIQPVDMLYAALEDAEFRDPCSLVLCRLLDLGVLAEFGYQPDDDLAAQIREQAESYEAAAWFTRLLANLEPWSRGEPIEVSRVTRPEMADTPPTHQTSAS